MGSGRRAWAGNAFKFGPLLEELGPAIGDRRDALHALELGMAIVHAGGGDLPAAFRASRRARLRLVPAGGLPGRAPERGGWLGNEADGPLRARLFMTSLPRSPMWDTRDSSPETASAVGFMLRTSGGSDSSNLA